MEYDSTVLTTKLPRQNNYIYYASSYDAQPALAMLLQCAIAELKDFIVQLTLYAVFFNTNFRLAARLVTHYAI